jgi:excisionase family DNA binding protein
VRTLKIGGKKIRQYTVADIMSRLEISKVTALNLLKSGKLKSVRIGRQHWINEEDLIGFLLGERPHSSGSYGRDLRYKSKNPILRFILSRLLK